MNLLRRKQVQDTIFEKIAFVATTLSIVALLAIMIFVFIRALPLFAHTNFIQFIIGDVWAPSNQIFGILGFIVASFLTTAVAVLIGIPIGLYTAVYIAEIASKKVSKIMLFMVDMLAAIPSVVYGFFGLVVVVPWIQSIFHLKSGATLLSASLILSLMILPTVVSLSTIALKSVPRSMDEASYALGATQIETIFKVKIPYAKSGILASFLLGLGRALGETMAVILVAGNSNVMPILNPIREAFLSGGRTLTGNIVLELSYASGVHQAALFATGVILFIFVSILNIVILIVKKRGSHV